MDTAITEDEKKEIEEGKQEIKDLDRQMINGVFVMVGCMVAAFIASTFQVARSPGKILCEKFVLSGAVTMAFWICRGDYGIHRRDAHVLKLLRKAGISSGWATFKQGLKSKNLMGPIDLMASTALVWMLLECGTDLVAAGKEVFVYTCAAGVVAGVLATVGMVALAKRSW